MTPPLDRGAVERPVIERFAAVVADRGSAPAVHDRDGVASYLELSYRVAEFAEMLDMSVPERAPVAIDLPTRRDYLAAMLAALSTGRPYVPIDVTFPQERNVAILEHAGATHVFADMPDGGVSLTELPAAEQITDLPSTGTGAHAAAYIAYTSGSTGDPKGVWQNQRGLLHDVWQYVDAAGIGPDDILSMLYSPSVVGAVRDIYGALLTGAQLVMCDLRRDGARNTLERLKPVTILHAMPPVLRALARESGEILCPAARLAYVAGDLFDGDDLSLLRSVTPPECDVYTGIGSSECSTLYRHWIIPREWRPEGTTVPVGYPIAERFVELLDEHDVPVPAGATGRIVVTSEFLAQGYWRAESPRFTELSPGIRRFDTGDYGRIRDDGLFEFQGRADRQIKVRGHRFEPAALEHALRAEPEVGDARVVIVGGDADPTIVAVAECGAGTSPMLGRELSDRLRRRLPPALVPHRILVVEALPRLPNFKVDDRAVRSIAEAASGVPADLAPEAGSPLAAVMQAWEAVTGTPPQPAMSFGEAGGDSLRALEFEVTLDRAGFVLAPGSLGADMTPLDVAERASPRAAANGGAAVIVFAPDGDFIGSRRLVTELRERIGAELAAMPLVRDEVARATPYPLSELARLAADDVAARYPDEVPLVLFGYSSGCRLAWEAAAELTRRGRTGHLVAVGDAPTTMRRSLVSVVAGVRNPRDVLSIPGRGLRALRRQWAYRRSARSPDADLPIDLVAQFYSLPVADPAVRLLALRRASAAAWTPQPMPIPVVVFAGDRWQPWELRRALGWRGLGSDVRVVPIGGGHDFLSAERVSEFAEVLVRETLPGSG